MFSAESRSNAVKFVSPARLAGILRGLFSVVLEVGCIDHAFGIGYHKILKA